MLRNLVRKCRAGARGRHPRVVMFSDSGNRTPRAACLSKRAPPPGCGASRLLRNLVHTEMLRNLVRGCASEPCPSARGVSFPRIESVPAIRLLTFPRGGANVRFRVRFDPPVDPERKGNHNHEKALSDRASARRLRSGRLLPLRPLRREGPPDVHDLLLHGDGRRAEALRLTRERERRAGPAGRRDSGKARGA